MNAVNTLHVFPGQAIGKTIVWLFRFVLLLVLYFVIICYGRTLGWTLPAHDPGRTRTCTPTDGPADRLCGDRTGHDGGHPQLALAWLEVDALELGGFLPCDHSGHAG